MGSFRTRIVASVVFVIALAATLVPTQASAAPSGYLAKYPWSDCVYVVHNGTAVHVSLDSFNSYRAAGYTFNPTVYYIPGQRLLKHASNAAEIFLMQPSSELTCPGHHLTYDEFLKAGGVSAVVASAQYWYKYRNNPTIYERNVFGSAMSFDYWRYYGFPTPVLSN